MSSMSTSPQPGSLGRYALLEAIGLGANGTVYRAHDPDLDRKVALRTVEVPVGAGDVERRRFEERFFAEARAAARLSHAGIAVVHDAGKDPRSGALFIVLELVEGTPLAALLAAGEAMEWRRALRLVGRVAEALHHAHSNGVVHRDLRPSNILVQPSGEPKVTDFGVARLETARITLSSVRRAFGSPLYMSPEQAVGESVDARTDVFSLGAVAYRLLTGRDAFAAGPGAAGDDPRAILTRVVYDSPPPPSSIRPELPPAVDAVVAHALARPRNDRYPDAGRLAEDLDDLLSGRAPRHAADRPWTEHPPGPPPQPPAGVSTWPGRFTANRRGAVDGILGRSLVRGFAGIVALALVVLLELFRRGGEVRPVLPAPSPPPAPAASPVADLQPALPLVPDLPPVKEPPTPSAAAHLVFELHHSLKNGLVVISVDGETIVERRFAGGVAKSILGVKLHGGRLRHVLDVKPGRRRVQVEVRWDDSRRVATLSGTFEAGATRRVSARLSRVGKSLDLDWR